MEYRELEKILSDSSFSATDRMLVHHLQEVWNESNPWILLAAAICSQSVREGHSFLDISKKPLQLDLKSVNWPSLAEWRAYASESSIIADSSKSSSSPLILADGNALYLSKYYVYEQKVAELLKNRINDNVSGESEAELDPVEAASKQPFYVITGGPGTGKTTLALRYINSVLDGWQGASPPRIVAVAPTGKAAARLSESISSGVSRMSDLEPARREEILKIPSLTIHRLLGVLAHRPGFRHDARNPIRCDVLLLDEASMVDLPLMVRLLEAVPHDCQVLFLGDKDQLASVEVGSVFSDILEAANDQKSGLSQSVQRLEKTYRFSEDSNIYLACRAARDGNFEALELLFREEKSDFTFYKTASESSRLPHRLLEFAHSRHRVLSEPDDPERALELLNQSMILSPTRRGPYGTVAINNAVLRSLRSSWKMDTLSNKPLHACPIIVLENDYERGLFNGDLGLLWGEPEGNARYAYFSDVNGESKRFPVTELPRFDDAFALTIHKSQGSEFHETICVFGQQNASVASRELVYTAFSRARERLIVFGDLEGIGNAIRKKVTRATRLSQLLV